MSPKEINRDTLNRFLVRCIGHASAVAIDAEFGLRVHNVEVSEASVIINLDNDHVVIVDIEHLVLRFPKPAKHQGDSADASN